VISSSLISDDFIENYADDELSITVSSPVRYQRMFIKSVPCQDACNLDGLSMDLSAITPCPIYAIYPTCPAKYPILDSFSARKKFRRAIIRYVSSSTQLLPEEAIIERVFCRLRKAHSPRTSSCRNNVPFAPSFGHNDMARDPISYLESIQIFEPMDGHRVRYLACLFVVLDLQDLQIRLGAATLWRDAFPFVISLKVRVESLPDGCLSVEQERIFNTPSRMPSTTLTRSQLTWVFATPANCELPIVIPTSSFSISARLNARIFANPGSPSSLSDSTGSSDPNYGGTQSSYEPPTLDLESRELSCLGDFFYKINSPSRTRTLFSSRLSLGDATTSGMPNKPSASPCDDAIFYNLDRTYPVS